MNKRKFLILIAIFIVALLFWYSSVIQDAFYFIVGSFNQLVTYNKFLAIIVFLIIAMLATLMSPFTNIPLVPVAVVTWGTSSTALLLLIGWVMGDILTYFIGRRFGIPAVKYFISDDKFESLLKNVKEHTSFVKALFVRLALPAELGYVFGIVKYPFLSYLLITIISESPLTIISTYTSEAVLIGDAVNTIYWIIIIAVALFISFRFIKNHRKGNS